MTEFLLSIISQDCEVFIYCFSEKLKYLGLIFGAGGP